MKIRYRVTIPIDPNSSIGFIRVEIIAYLHIINFLGSFLIAVDILDIMIDLTQQNSIVSNVLKKVYGTNISLAPEDLDEEKRLIIIQKAYELMENN